MMGVLLDTEEYFKSLSGEFDKAFSVAKEARSKGYDPKPYVEVRPAPDLASRVEGLTEVDGIEAIIRKAYTGQSRSALAFAVVKEICTNSTFDKYETIKRIEVAVRVGVAIFTEGILVAPTEGIQSVKRYKNYDNTDYIAVVYAGPIRGAGGTGAAMSVALADQARKLFNIGVFKPQQDEIERYVEEAELYHTRAARLQYKPSDDDLRVIVSNCPICVDGVPTDPIDVGAHANLKRIGYDGKEVPITNRVRGGVPLVLCEGIAQKAKKVIKETKNAGLDWEWLNKIIRVEVKKSDEKKDTSKFLDELVAGRPILAYPGFQGGFRLRYGRSRFTGIAAKGFNPASMILTTGFIAIGTQVKIEFPGKGCVAVPVDTIEGPVVKLRSGEVLRVNDAELALSLKDEIAEILSLGDMLVTYGDFKKSNNPLQPTSYVEEYWEAQLKNAGFEGQIPKREILFKDSFDLSMKYGVPVHPKFLYEFQYVGIDTIKSLAMHIAASRTVQEGASIFEVKELAMENNPAEKRTLELLNVPHKLYDGKIVISEDYAESLISSLGFVSKDGVIENFGDVMRKYEGTYENQMVLLNAVAPFKIPKRSTVIGARIGRPEKARERLMKPAPNVLFPIGSYGGKERNLTRAYLLDSKRFKSELETELAVYYCRSCKRVISTQYCYECRTRAILKRECPNCKSLMDDIKCPVCNIDSVAYNKRKMDLVKAVSESMKRVHVSTLPQTIKGVKGMMNKDKVIEPIDKGILRALHGVYIFKDGTSRFDATDVPITHFYPREIGTSVEALRSLGYEKDYLGNELVSDDQLLELKHQDVLLNRRGADYLLKVSRFVDELLQSFYDMPAFYSAASTSELIGKLVVTLSPHTSCGVLNRIIGFTSANVGFAHPYIISARRRNCDGDEDTTILLLDLLINFSKEYLPTSVGGTMDTPLILTLNVMPEEVDDEAHAMEVVSEYPLSFYEKTKDYPYPSDIKIELVEDRLKNKTAFNNLLFTHLSSVDSITYAPKKSSYTQLKTMQDKVDAEFKLMDAILAIDRRDAAKRLILSHFIPDLIGNLHSFSKQIFRCSDCNAKYRRVPLSGKCTKDGGKLLLTISKGGVEKYLSMALNLAERYEIDMYIRQRLVLLKEEIDNVFQTNVIDNKTGQFNLSKFM